MAFTEDFTIFFETADFAVTGTYSGTGYSGIFNDDFSSDEIIPGTVPTFELATSDAANMSISGTISINSTDYVIMEKQPDGSGVTMLYLREA